MSAEALSDSELRTKLFEYGYSVGPVTQTTRNILVKKLKALMESRGTANSRHSMAARYSSDDTDDDTSASAKKKKKALLNTRRQTLANPMPPPAVTPITSPNIGKNSSKKKTSRNLNTTESEVDYNDTLSSLTNRSIIKTDKTYIKNNKQSKNNDGLETGSDSDAVEDISQQAIIVTKFGGGTTKLYNDRTLNITAADVNLSKSYETNWRRSSKDAHDINSHTNSSIIKDERYLVNLPKSRTHLDSNRNDSLPKENIKKDDILSTFETPYLSEFTRRLSVQASVNPPSLSKSTLKGQKYRVSGLSNTLEVKETDSNGHFISPLRNTYPSSSSMTYVTSSLDKTRDINKVFKSSNVLREDVKNNQNFISKILVIVLALFFGGLTIVYLRLEGKTDNFPLLSADSDIPVCILASYGQNKRTDCIPEDKVQDTLLLIKRLHQILLKQAVSAKCDSTKEPPYLNNNDIKTFLNYEVMAHLLIFKNPKWGIFLIEIADDNETHELLDSMDEVILKRSKGKLGLLIPEPDLPLQCLMRKRIFTVFSTLLIAAFGALVIIGCQKMVLAYWRYRKNTEREVFNLVSEIINILEIHHQSFVSTNLGSIQETYLAINHIRDNLIPPKDRKNLAGLWEKAVKFLDENESRIRREVQLVAGEEFQVWRWLPSNSTTSNSIGSNSVPKMSKVWQGSAFETMEGSVNSLACSPTPCLKIRHMFDPDVEFEEDWETKVKDAILEKCSENVNILHIKVDRGSREGCVYMKCLSQDDAGKAYKALHGCWFDGHLVTVKYLRLERYHERFPEAVHFSTSLKPSNNQRLSMQAHYWTNSSEAN
ncbi:PREDICTED: inner nuclear membrane protein Man1 isoform X2 [Ceratosolen solmsi marchali]|uniref:LEM domain-containing protein 2 n=1 Tax=Ceratosolen solmsi marchali TaxID=326594 RepID=A0AAJ7E099_9HYME|nr:PREDICTED: inner nuclear membrane protein Man1 isoform X2 [Ceratosolen solmsi marchali]